MKDITTRYQQPATRINNTREHLELATNNYMTSIGLTPEEIRKHMHDPPLCFCNKKAHRSETALGTMYDCHNLQDENAQKICGFHVDRKSVV